jgi:hypothetical protein
MIIRNNTTVIIVTMPANGPNDIYEDEKKDEKEYNYIYIIN